MKTTGRKGRVKKRKLNNIKVKVNKKKGGRIDEEKETKE
jgi:pyruvate/2-oxoglutarate dehydrogenase complex dihydrolipoamide dehydrogenase (E3) component